VRLGRALQLDQPGKISGGRPRIEQPPEHLETDDLHRQLRFAGNPCQVTMILYKVPELGTDFTLPIQEALQCHEHVTTIALIKFSVSLRFQQKKNEHTLAQDEHSNHRALAKHSNFYIDICGPIFTFIFSIVRS